MNVKVIFPILLVHILCFFNLADAQDKWIAPKSVEDHYWRDFNGLISSGAIPGGIDENGETTYIAQFTTPAEYNVHISRLHTIPAVIRKGQNFAVGAYFGRALSSNDTTNTKVMCTSYTSRYKWMSPTSIVSPNCRFVIGGYENRLPLYIGRAQHNKEKVVGKIFPDNTNNRPGLISPYRGGEVYHDVYEVLTYCY